MQFSYTNPSTCRLEDYRLDWIIQTCVYQFSYSLCYLPPGMLETMQDMMLRITLLAWVNNTGNSGG